jgi:hypothetical protein
MALITISPDPAVCHMVIYESDRLHKGIHDGPAHKLKTPFGQVFGNGI